MGAMRLGDLVSDLDGVKIRSGTGPAGGIDVAVAGITADSRDVAPGFVFVAIPGTKVDGARFIPEAERRGAAAVVASAEAALSADCDVPVILSDNPRLTLSQMAARLYSAQPSTICAVTGTNGKTSVASFLRQIWIREGHKAASMGTLGVVTSGGIEPLGHTTPDPVRIHKTLEQLTRDGVTHLVMEASSHGLAQHRMDGVRVKAGALTNLSRDHLDYHESSDDYLAAKLRLFTQVVREDGWAVLNADADCYSTARDVVNAIDLKLISVGEAGETLRIIAAKPTPQGIDLSFAHKDVTYEVALPLVGAFQASNALMAAGLALATGSAIESVVESLSKLTGADGRMERVARLSNGATVYVDYAHTPDALETALKALRPHTEGRLHVVFGAGGDRDRGKRPLMGQVAHTHADVVIVTDDNPRNEEPSLIRAEILAAAPDAQEVGDRRAAIDAALAGLESGDTLLVAGKGHESGQTVQGVTHPFKDADVIRELLSVEARP